MRIGGLFEGYSGLSMAVADVFGADLAWYSEIDKGALKILGHHYPTVPNVGDITKADWSTVEPVDILTGGFPCQDVSTAGRRAGIRPGTRSGLWSQFAYAISQLKPRLVVIENVRGLLSAEAHSDVEPCPWCVGDDTDGALRALGAVLGDLASIGYDASWHGLPASSVGAPHGRFRVFVVAYPAGERWAGRIEPWPHVEQDRPEPAHLGPSGRAVSLLPTPTVQDGANTGGASQFDRNSVPLNALVTLLPTPACNDMGEGKTPDEWDAWTERMKAAHGNGNGHGASLSIEAQRLLPTPSAVNGGGGGAQRSQEALDRGDHQVNLTDIARLPWGQYAAAITRWEHLTGPAPAPTETGAKGNPRLSAAFSEWMMGLPVGWVTDVPGITRNEALRALGNGVVPAQAEAAVRYLLNVCEAAA